MRLHWGVIFAFLVILIFKISNSKEFNAEGFFVITPKIFQPSIKNYKETEASFILNSNLNTSSEFSKARYNFQFENNLKRNYYFSEIHTNSYFPQSSIEKETNADFTTSLNTVPVPNVDSQDSRNLHSFQRLSVFYQESDIHQKDNIQMREPVFTDTCPYLENIFNTDGQILDFKEGKVFVVEKGSYLNPVIVDVKSGNKFSVPYSWPVKTGFITPQGLIFIGTTPTGDSLYDLNNGKMYRLGLNAGSVKVAGNYCIWTMRRLNQNPFEVKYDTLFLRDLATAANTIITNNAAVSVVYFTKNDLSNNGVVAYIDNTQNLIKYYNSIYTTITFNGIPESPIGYSNPLTDGYNIVVLNQQDRYRVLRVFGEQNGQLTDGYPQQLIDPVVHYQVNNKNVAYINVPLTMPFHSEIRVRDSVGHNFLIESAGIYDLSLEKLNPRGDLMYKRLGQNRKLAVLNGPIIPICYSAGSTVYSDTSWYIIEDSKILKIDLNVSPDILDDSAVFVAKDSLHQYDKTDFSNQFNGPGKMISVTILGLPKNGILQKAGFPVVPFENINSADLDNLRYIPAKGFTGIDTIHWAVTDGYGYTSSEALLMMKVVDKPGRPILSGFKASYCINNGTQKMKISNFPASASGIQIDVLLDTAKLVVNASDSSFSFDPADYFIGDHAIKTIFKNIAGFATDTSYFKVFPAVTPVVKASADITNVINLSTPVTITATNIGGGGTNPLYSFAKDKGFINILQVQSSNNKLVIEPGSLEVGNNWIYVRMLTNELCYSNSTGSDSINITRDAATGIVDLDNPGRIIRVYPNPFSEKITIDGLISSKKYLINIYYTTGQIKLSKYVINQLSINLNTGDLTKGVYWLSIYDDIHRKFLGSVKIIKQ